VSNEDILIHYLELILTLKASRFLRNIHQTPDGTLSYLPDLAGDTLAKQQLQLGLEQ